MSERAFPILSLWLGVEDAARVGRRRGEGMIDREILAEVLFEVYDHGSQPNAFREADAIIAGLRARQATQVCAWCPSFARGSAWHNDGRLYPSCGQIDHGGGWVPDEPRHGV